MVGKRRRYTPEERAKMFKPTYFFGYGSLIHPKGINGRGLKTRYTIKDLSPCTLHNYSRSMCGFYGGRNFYGLLSDKGSKCNGVVFRIDNWYDYRALLVSEGGTSSYKSVRTYWPISVAEYISEWEVPKGFRVITLICKRDKSNWGRVERSYIKFCHEAAKSWGHAFEADFLATGGIPYNSHKMKAIAKKHKIRLW